MNWIRNSIAYRISAAGFVALLLVLAALTALLTVYSTRDAREQRIMSLRERASAVAMAIDSVDQTSRTMVQRVYPVLAAMVGKDFSLDESGGVLSADGAALNDNVVPVDRFNAQTGGVATIFARQGESFKRISTSVKKEDGTRAIGTLLDPKGKAYAAVSKGNSYTGRATLFGKPYMTHYEAVRDEKSKVVGVLFIGFELSAFDGTIEQVVRGSRFFDSGGIYLIDPKGAAADAVFAMHPSAPGKKVLEAFGNAGSFLAALAAAKDKAVDSPGLYSPQGGDRWAVMQVSASTGLWVVAEVSDGEAMKTHWRTLLPFWLALAAVCLALGAGLLWTMRRQVGSPLRELSRAARAVAAGTLNQAYTSDRPDEIGQVIRDVEAMRQRFLSLLTTLRHSADSIATASGEIAAGNQDLSGRTEKSAASVQQTASSMEQFTGAVKQTASSASAAQSLAASTLTAASRGTDIMQSVVSTMGDINASANKISDIISVIDGIAFQTNILALNAAVEAARAGEQGRGFAVVAAEVRSLAQRSATAAKEIKSLIGGSAAKVEDGTQLVASAGAAMQAIRTEVGRVNDIIGEISGAAVEQSNGIGQINAAVSQLDRNTQQNAALVEESAAAAHSLKEQAVRLSAVLQEFEL